MIMRWRTAEGPQLCLTPIRPLSGAQIGALSERQPAVVAAHLNVSKGLVSQWERDEKTRRA